MTQIVDPQGNSAYIQYDSNFRVTSITDALGQVSTLAYVIEYHWKRRLLQNLIDN